MNDIDLAEHEALSVGFGLNIRSIKALSEDVEQDVIKTMTNACGSYFGQWYSQEEGKTHSSLYGWRLIAHGGALEQKVTIGCTYLRVKKGRHFGKTEKHI